MIYVFSSCKKTSSSTSSTSTTTSVASPSVNTSINIGGTYSISGFPWSYGGCSISPNPTLTAICGTTTGTTTVELTLGSGFPVSSGIYTLTSSMPSIGQARLKIFDPPGQPSGFQWYSIGPQTVSVTLTTMNAVVATFSNIPCTQSTTSTPVVTANGIIICQ